MCETRCKSHVEEPYSWGSIELAHGGSSERNGVIGVAATLEPGAFTCYPLSSVRLRDEDDEAKVPKVGELTTRLVPIKEHLRSSSGLILPEY